MTTPVEDLPQTWERPAFEHLVAALEELELQPPVWSHERRRSEILKTQEVLVSHRKGDVTRYLSSIIKSPLVWIESDEQREQLWQLASKRMSERCGRTAMGEVKRQWPFRSDGEIFKLTIREPALTGDSLGFKTWGSSYVLAQHLPRLVAKPVLSSLFEEARPPTVLELGSGTGLLGLAAAALWRVSVMLSDLPDIVPNLQNNADRNKSILDQRGGSVTVGPLTWGGSEAHEVDRGLFGELHQFQIVLVADPLYDDNHPALLASAISQHLSRGTDSRAVVMVPKRDETTAGLLTAFKRAMLESEPPLRCDEEDELAGQDDWIEDEEEGQVRCWLGIFSRGGA